jgi:uncharacterized RDD family membrane protein YckC
MNKPLASIGERFTARFFDGLFAMVFGAMFYGVARVFGFPLELAVLAWFFYLLFCDGLPGGQSLGKRITKSSVVHVKTGLPCKYWQSCVRNFSLIVLSVFDCMFIAGKQRRRLGDYLGQTKVIRLT